MPWQLQEAKQKFSEVVERALNDGPQIVTRRGEEVAVIMSMREYRRLRKRKRSFKEFLLRGPDLSALELERRKDLPRDVEL
ncbi:MAG: type II toxin-antitoxin system Phd/YefM family antitoxin [Myxococcales bacterium]|nr:type II toxin-antitoxin system Phd/YefM family antitoxin [Myxococcales bacterium]